MSRRSQDEDYSDNYKTSERINIEYSDNEEYDDNQEDIIPIEDINYKYYEQIYDLTRLLKDYVSDQGLPLCQYLTPCLVSEFTEESV